MNLKYPSHLTLKEDAVAAKYPLEITDGKAVVGINPQQPGLGFENPDLEITSVPIYDIQNQPLILFGQPVTKTKIYEKSTQKTDFLVVVPYPDNRNYSILANYEFADGKVDENMNKIFDQILSTFKFTGTASNLQTYTNSAYKYMVFLPSDWKQFDQNSTTDFPDFRKGEYQFTVSIYPVSHKTIQSYLVESDKTSQTAWEGTPGMKVVSTKLTKINTYSVVQRKEEFLAAGFAQPVINTYFLNNGFIYSLQLRYLGNDATPDQTALNEYNDILFTLKFTN